MSIQFTLEQEQMIQRVVNAGAYSSTAEALNAALAVVKHAATSDFDGSRQELEGLLVEGLASPELSEEHLWHEVDRKTDALLATHKPGLLV